MDQTRKHDVGNAKNTPVRAAMSAVEVCVLYTDGWSNPVDVCIVMMFSDRQGRRQERTGSRLCYISNDVISVTLYNISLVTLKSVHRLSQLLNCYALYT